MSRTPVTEWQQLSALYELADAMAPAALAAWLAALRAQGHPLLAQLEQMLAARSQVQHNDFLHTLPRLPVAPEAPAPHAITWVEGSRIGPYRLLRHLGAGGMAEVWQAQRVDGAFERTVAIKLLFRHEGSHQRDSFAQRFTRERDILASLHHPHIAGLHDAGVTTTGQPWLALEYVEGETLIQWCDAQRLDLTARVRLFRQVLLAVQHAHANLVIHRDLKPGNILVTAQGEVRLLDFGIAKLMEAQGDTLAETELTRQSGRPLTPQYASPEQLLGQPLTTACDVYSLGVVLYELLSGERPYELKMASAAQLEQAILDIEPRAPSRRALPEAAAQARDTSAAALRKALASDLDAIVLRAMAKQTARRYASVEALRADLDHWLAGEPVEARTPSAAYRVAKFARRHRLGVALGMSAVLSLIGATTIAVVMGLQAREDSARAGAARDFMLGLFKRADQEKARGADITARELLETGRKDVLTRMAAQPRLQAELLQGIGTIQKDMGEYVGADSTYADAARIYGQLGMPRETALAHTAHANVAMRMGNIKLAETALQQAKELGDRHSSDAELNARMSEVQGWIAFIKGEMEGARGLFLQSYEQALKAFGLHHAKTMDALRGRIYAEQQLRNFDGALGLLVQLETIAAQTGGVDAREMASLATDRADLLLFAGRYAELLDHVLTALPKCASSLGPNHTECKELMYRKVGVLLRLGMTSRASEERASLEAIAEDRKSPASGANALMLILKIDSAAGPTGQQAASSERVRSLVDSGASVMLSPNLKAKALLALAEARLRANAPDDANRWIGQAVLLQRRGDGSTPITMLGAVAKSLQGVSALQRGQVDAALLSLLAAQADLSKLVGPEHPATHFSSLNLAIGLEARGRADEALDVVDQAEPVLRKAMGADAPMYLRVKELQSHLQRVVLPDGSTGQRSRRSESGVGIRKSTPTDFFS